jgi:CRISPR-associated protein (TIGR03984 family)
MRDKKWQRKIDEKVNAAVEHGVSTAGLPDRADEWMRAQAADLTWLLAHADDAVIWGRREPNGSWTTSTTLNGKALQQVRLFSREAELLAWRDGDGQWQARVIRDGAAAPLWTAAFDEYQMIVGTDFTTLANGFTRWVDGAQGMSHDMPALPVKVADPLNPPELKEAPPRLIVRHYLADEALARIVASRLVGFEEVGK